MVLLDFLLTEGAHVVGGPVGARDQDQDNHESSLCQHESPKSRVAGLAATSPVTTVAAKGSNPGATVAAIRLDCQISADGWAERSAKKKNQCAKKADS